ncbi:unnamed protein product [Pelagomonas calceolata]|uniref:Uncharacterized protein n=1 Tax=Pelagomonas calceolata TaxID=35677 RepID=A0A8J2WRC9_9STRA|nr:unnamed protein product [Pelagomonas calceolata]
MGRRRWGLLLAVVVGGDDDLRSRLASRAAAIRAARGEKGAPAPPVVLRPPAPRVDHSDAGEGDAVAGAAGVTVPVAIDGADARLRAEPGEALIVAARRFAEAHLSRYEGGGCGFGDRSCVVDRLYEALREEDAQLREKAAERDAKRRFHILAAVGLVVMIAGMALHHLKQRAQHEVAAAAARAEALLKAEAAALRAAHDVDVKRAEERSRAAAAALQAAHETRIKEIRAKASTSQAEADEVQRLKRANEALRRQLRDKEPVSVSLASARKHLQKAAELLLNGEGNAHAHEKEIERWDRVIQSHPEQIEQAEAARTQWLAAHADDREQARRFMRSLVPPSVWRGMKLADLEARGLSKACAKRIFQTPALWLCRAEAERVAKFHVADLRGRYAYDRLTLLELRAVFVSLPAFSDEAKASWKQGLEDKLRQFETGDLPPAKVRPPCFSEEGPFDPDADDAVMAPAAREVGVLTPVTAAARAAPSAAAPVADPSADAPVAAPSAALSVPPPGNPSNDLMAAIRARSDQARPARRPAPAAGGDLLAAIRARRRSRTPPPRSRRKPAKVVVPAAPGDVLAAIRAQKTKLKPKVQDENGARTPPRKTPGPPGRSPRSAFCAVINTRAARDKVPAAGCV